MKNPKRKTRRLVMRPIEIKDYDSWKQAYLKMLPKRRK
jgi:hypothetical protein